MSQLDRVGCIPLTNLRGWSSLCSFMEGNPIVVVFQPGEQCLVELEVSEAGAGL